MRITGATRVFAVIGDPVAHSLSPLMHNGWIEDHGLDAAYVALHLRSRDPAAALRTLEASA
jgi:shikimate dehydrogenase